eukprot:309653_1
MSFIKQLLTIIFVIDVLLSGTEAPRNRRWLMNRNIAYLSVLCGNNNIDTSGYSHPRRKQELLNKHIEPIFNMLLHSNLYLNINNDNMESNCNKLYSIIIKIIYSFIYLWCIQSRIILSSLDFIYHQYNIISNQYQYYTQNNIII